MYHEKSVKYIIAGTVVVAVIAALVISLDFITQEKVSNAVANIYQNGTLIRSIDLESVEEIHLQLKGRMEPIIRFW